MPNEEQTYRQSIADKIDGLSSTLHTRMDGFEEDVRNSLSRVETTQALHSKKLDYTNGKVRKIIIALVLLAGIVIGQVVTSPEEIVKIFAHVI